LKRKLIKSGYTLTERLINAIEYGVPQDRDRIILIGFLESTLADLGRNQEDQLLSGFNWIKHSSFSANDIFQLQWPTQEKFIEDSIRLCPFTVPVELTVEYWFKKNEVETHANSRHFFTPRAGLEKFKVIDEGDDLKKSYKRLHRWRYSPTAAYGNNEVHLHPYKARRISAAEALAIQSLPKEFEIPDCISLTDMFKTIGNGVPYLAGRGLAMNIYDFVNKTPVKDEKMQYAKTNG
jgi:DNA (cytosine-5)-methyltransferase 1